MNVNAALQQELATFEQRKSDLLATDEGRFVLIHEQTVIGTYNDEQDAITEGYRTWGSIPFLVKQIVSVESPANFVNNHLGF